MKIKKYLKIVVFTGIILLLMNFNTNSSSKSVSDNKVTLVNTLLVEKPKDLKTPKGMVWVKGKTFIQGAKEGDKFAMPREMPAHQVAVDGFFIDITEVTNKQFKAFVKATAYKTVAERVVDWEVMKKEFPDETPKPNDSILQPGCLVFNKSVGKVASMDNYTQWWNWKIGANWKHPDGPDSSMILIIFKVTIY